MPPHRRRLLVAECSPGPFAVFPCPNSGGVQRACKLFLAGLCPHDVFSKTKLDMGPCRGVHDDGLKEVSVPPFDFPSHF